MLFSFWACDVLLKGKNNLMIWTINHQNYFSFADSIERGETKSLLQLSRRKSLWTHIDTDMKEFSTRKNWWLNVTFLSKKITEWIH